MEYFNQISNNVVKTFFESPGRPREGLDPTEIRFIRSEDERLAGKSVIYFRPYNPRKRTGAAKTTTYTNRPVVYRGEWHTADECKYKRLDHTKSVGIYAGKMMLEPKEIPAIPCYAVQDHLSIHYESLFMVARFAGEMNGRDDPFTEELSSVLNRYIYFSSMRVVTGSGYLPHMITIFMIWGISSEPHLRRTGQSCQLLLDFLSSSLASRAGNLLSHCWVSPSLA